MQNCFIKADIGSCILYIQIQNESESELSRMAVQNHIHTHAKQHFLITAAMQLTAALSMLLSPLLYFPHNECCTYTPNWYFPSSRKQHIQRRARGFYSLDRALEKESSLNVSPRERERAQWKNTQHNISSRIHIPRENCRKFTHMPILNAQNMADVWWYLWLNLSLPHGATLKNGWIIE